MLDWLRTSDNGKGEEAATNNHGTWYDVQATRYAFFVGRTDVACDILGKASQRRIKVQIDPDGSLPLELVRADPFHYELYDLKALFDLATLARGGNVDLWNYQTSDGRGLHKAFDFMVPYVDPQKPWPYPQSGTPSRTDYIELLRRAALAYADLSYEQRLQSFYGTSLKSNLLMLEYPK